MDPFLQWRICFRFEEGDAYDVEVSDCPTTASLSADLLVRSAFRGSP